MSRSHLTKLFSAVSLACLLASCAVTPTEEPVDTPAGKKTPPTRVKVSYDDLPGWKTDALEQAWPAFEQSCRGAGKKAHLKEPCGAAASVDGKNREAVRAFFETYFSPWRVYGENGKETGLSTGYYEPLLHGSRTRQGKYRTPLHSEPADLLTIDIAGAYPKVKGMRLRGKLAGKKVVPYETRGQLAASGKLAGREIVWVDDVVDAFFLEIQGSGRVELDGTGETIRLAYANQNGHPFRSVGRHLIDIGELKSGQASMQKIKAWIKAHPEREREILDYNPSYVFFREEKIPDPSVGPKGALGVPLTPQRSIAVDRNHVPLGAPVYIDTTKPYSDEPLRQLMMAQDTGGAIRGPIRCDFFWGFGDEAGKMAGKMQQRLAYWILLPKDSDGK